MTNKYYRHQPSVSRDPSFTTVSEKVPNWLSDFANSFEKESAKPKSQSYSLYDQINGILGQKSKYSTVEEAVDDMKKRTGLSDYIEQIKQAQGMMEAQNPFAKMPEVKTFIDNYVKEHPGTSVDAVIHELLKLNPVKEHLPQKDDVPEAIKRYINTQITETRSNTGQTSEHLQLGKVDLKNDKNTVKDNDPFSGCMPNREGM